MNKLICRYLLPWGTLAAGIGGFFLSRVLFTDGQDGKRLLITNHPAGILLLCLCVAVFGLLALAVFKLPKDAAYEKLFPKSGLRSIGRFLGAIGIAITCLRRFDTPDVLSVIVLVLGIAAALCLLLSASLQLFGIRPHYLFFFFVTVYFMALGLSLCRTWGSQPQVMRYLGSLLANLFLILYTYQHTAAAAGEKNTRALLLCGNAALFFCCVAFAKEFDFLYAASAIWLTLDVRPVKLTDKE